VFEPGAVALDKGTADECHSSPQTILGLLAILWLRTKSSKMITLFGFTFKNKIDKMMRNTAVRRSGSLVARPRWRKDSP
jgi:hypothetical protein